MIRANLAFFLDDVVFSRSFQRLTDALAAFGALVMPCSCVICGAWDTSLCQECSALFRAATARPFHAETEAESLPDVERTAGDLLRGTTADAGYPTGSREAPYGPLPVIAAGRYGRAVSVVLLAYKNHGHVDLAPPVAAALVGALHHAVPAFRTGRTGAESVLVVPVPTRASSRRRRGYDPLMLLLSRLKRSGHLPAGTELVPAVRHRPLPARLASAVGCGGGASGARTALAAAFSAVGGGQKGLGRRRRRMNVLHSMEPSPRARPAVAGRDCLIVDDVLTTGATIAEVHRVLVASGARVLGAVVIAATAAPAGRGAAATGTRAHDTGRAPLRTSSELPEISERQGMNKGQG
ncbi:ComF family protein [Arthrobacter sp. NamB2]|uniref:ComF family protein n=1 Tax=Arthrobacter sp. NamB2 TaxID=2576035 RepID=UPI00167AD457|nr:phosphoribosyltransferase family protein [Arthrobacter sp. NamB2]